MAKVCTALLTQNSLTGRPSVLCRKMLHSTLNKRSGQLSLTSQVNLEKHPVGSHSVKVFDPISVFKNEDKILISFCNGLLQKYKDLHTETVSMLTG